MTRENPANYRRRRTDKVPEKARVWAPLITALTSLAAAVMTAIIISMVTTVQKSLGSLEQITKDNASANVRQEGEIADNRSAISDLSITLQRLTTEESDMERTMDGVENRLSHKMDKVGNGGSGS